MRRVILLSILAGSSASLGAAEPFPADDRSAVPKVSAAQPICRDEGVRQVDEIGGAGLKRLDQLPPADHILTVLRTEDGCIKPVIVRHGIGARR